MSDTKTFTVECDHCMFESSDGVSADDAIAFINEHRHDRRQRR